MDQNVVVVERTECGKRLIAALAATGFEVPTAFWAKPTDDGRWYLYLASKFVDEHGPLEGYRRVQAVMKGLADLWIDFADIKVLGLRDSLTAAANALIAPNSPRDPYAVPIPKPFPGMTWYGGPSLSDVSIDGAYIYPPQSTTAP